MKTHPFTVKVPNWANWIAIDWFGVLIAFEQRPIIDGHDWIARGKRKDIFAFESQSYRGWERSLKKVGGAK